MEMLREGDPFYQLSVAPLCDRPTRRQFSPDQLAALHAFKHEVLAAGYRLYEKVPPDVIGPVITAYLKQLVNELEPAPTENKD